jgi:transcriptional regulator with XRE-family HTH domain
MEREVGVKTIGDYMQEARTEAGYTRHQLADLAGIPLGSLRSYEAGAAFPGILNLIALADALNMSIDDYIGHRIKG